MPLKLNVFTGNFDEVKPNVYVTEASSGVFTAKKDATHLVDTSGSTATITLPAVAADIYVTIKDKGNAEVNNITISPASGTIDGAANHVITSNYGSVTFVSDGTSWYIL